MFRLEERLILEDDILNTVFSCVVCNMVIVGLPGFHGGGVMPSAG